MYVNIFSDLTGIWPSFVNQINEDYSLEKKKKKERKCRLFEI